MVRAQHGVDDREHRGQDAVGVEARHLVDRRHDLGAHRLGGRRARRGEIGVEPGLEQRHEPGGDRRVVEQHADDVPLRERDDGLAQVAQDRSQDRHLAPVEAGPLSSTLRLRRAALLDGFAGTVEALRGVPEPPPT